MLNMLTEMSKPVPITVASTSETNKLKMVPKVLLNMPNPGNDTKHLSKKNNVFPPAKCWVSASAPAEAGQSADTFTGFLTGVPR